MQKFRRLKDVTFSKYRFFILIDGLDEFKGDHQELVDLVADISSVSHIKICVASRPWIMFQDAFRTTPSLMMQNLTRRDIVTFTRTMFNRHPGFCEMSIRDPSFAEGLFYEVTQKSSRADDMLRNRRSLELLLRHGVLSHDKEVIFMNVCSMILRACRQMVYSNTHTAECTFAPSLALVELLVPPAADRRALAPLSSLEAVD